MKANLFIIDDNVLFGKMTHQSLRKISNELSISYFESVEKSISLVKNEKPHLIFLDDQLPGINGVEVIPLVKELSPKTRMVLISASSKISLADMAFRRGADAFIVKDSSFFKNAYRILLEFEPEFN